MEQEDLSYYEQVAEKKVLGVLTPAMTKNELEKHEENEAEHLDRKLVHERKYWEAEYMHLNFGENELLAKKKQEPKKLKVPEEGD